MRTSSSRGRAPTPRSRSSRSGTSGAPCAARRPVGAAGALDAEAVIYGVGMPTSPDVGAAIDAALATARERLAPWAATRGTLLTFDERSGGVGDALEPAAAERLAGIASAWDPDGLLLANHVAGA